MEEGQEVTEWKRGGICSEVSEKASVTHGDKHRGERVSHGDTGEKSATG